MDQIPYEVDSFYIFDRAYMDTKQLYAIDKVGAFFVVREKQRMVYEVVEDKRYNNPKTGVMSDTMIKLTGQKTKKQYLSHCGESYSMSKRRTVFVFYTNNIEVSAEDVALLYKYRWSVGSSSNG